MTQFKEPERLRLADMTVAEAEQLRADMDALRAAQLRPGECTHTDGHGSTVIVGDDTHMNNVCILCFAVVPPMRLL